LVERKRLTVECHVGHIKRRGMPSGKMKASSGWKKYDREGWKKGLKRRSVRKDNRKDQGIKKGKAISPSNVRSRVRGSSRVEKDTITEINDAVRRSREAMPKEPPSTSWIRKGGIIRVFSEEVTVLVTAGSRTSKGSRVTMRLRKVNLNEIPAGSKCVGGLVGNKKEAIRGGLNGSIKKSSSNQRDGNSWVVVGKKLG
jgi:hypothetical protein